MLGTADLGSVAQVFSGISVTAQRLIEDRQTSDKYVPVVGMTAIQPDESLLIDARTTADRAFAARCLVSPRDVLISSRSTQIRSCIVPGGVVPFAINATLLAIRPDAEHLDPEFLLAYLRSPIGQSNLLRIAGSSTAQLNITVRAMESLPIPLPPIAQQKKLAALFRTAETQKRLAIQAAEIGYRLATEVVFRDLVTTEKKKHG